MSIVHKKIPAAIWNETDGKVYCSNCGAELSGKIGVCPECNATLTHNPHILYFMTHEHSTCVNCQYRKEHYKVKPQECKECGWEFERDEPYYTISPVWDADENAPLYPECAKYSYYYKHDPKFTRSLEEYNKAPYLD